MQKSSKLSKILTTTLNDMVSFVWRRKKQQLDFVVFARLLAKTHFCDIFGFTFFSRLIHIKWQLIVEISRLTQPRWRMFHHKCDVSCAKTNNTHTNPTTIEDPFEYMLNEFRFRWICLHFRFKVGYLFKTRQTLVIPWDWALMVHILCLINDIPLKMNYKFDPRSA